MAMHLETREVVEARIESVRGDIEFLEATIGRMTGQSVTVTLSLPSSRHARGRPPLIRTLTQELTALEGFRAWLHSHLVELRGDPIFTSGAARLEELGIIARPGRPRPPRRFRPGLPASRRKRGSAPPIRAALRSWVDLVRASYARRGQRITVVRAIAIAEGVIRDRYKRGFVGLEADYYAEVRRHPKR